MSTRLVRSLALLLCILFCGEHLALAARPEKTASAATSVQDQIARRGVGHRVKLIRSDGSEIKGRIVALHDTAVDVESSGSTTFTTVRYADVAKIKGPGLSTGAKVGIGVGVGVLVCVGIAAIVITHEINKPWKF